MEFLTHYSCTLCGSEYTPPVDFYTCPKCGEKGILDIHYDYERLKKTLNKQYFADNTDYSMWRYEPLMSVSKAHIDKTLRVGWTPHYKSNQLAKRLKMDALYIKDEGLNPTGSLKDRASAVAVLKAMENDNVTIACSSTGNAASSLAGNAARMGLKTVIFVPERAPIGKLAQLLAYGADVISVEGDYKAAFQLSKAAIDHFGWYNRNAAINPHMVEGKKTVAYEIAEQLDFDVPDWVVVSVGDGCTIAGVYKGFYDLFAIGITDRIPKILGVQSEGCAPFYEAAKEGRELIETDENTIADSIAVGIPRNPTKALNAVKRSGGQWITVTDEQILESIVLLGKEEGVFAEPAAAASMAGLLEALEQNVVSRRERVSVIVTGNGLKDTKSMEHYGIKPKRLKPDLDLLIEYMQNNEGGRT